jgi:hyaluronan synthase
LSFSFLPCFGILSLLFFVQQNITSILNHQRNKTLLQTPVQKNILLLIIGYRENIVYWTHCLQHIRKLYPESIHHIYICIDGNDPEDQYMIDHAHLLLDSFSIPYSVLALSHDGKRNALYKGIRYIRSQYPFQWHEFLLAVTDSDTLLSPCSLQRLAQCLESHEKNGCVTGLLEIFNQSSSLLCRIVHARYLYAFAIERGSYSYFGTMTCCSGPLSMYRLSLLDDELLETFYHQSFCHYLSETGDDRHLTNLILAKGFFSRQTSLSTAKTECPETLSRFLLQQIRWTRSYYRELYWQWKAVPAVSSLCFSVFIIRDFFYHYFLLFVLFHILYIFPNLLHLCLLIVSSLFITFLRCLVLVFFFRQFSCFLYFFYIPLYFFFLLPIHVYCLLSFCNNQWLTSARKQGKQNLCSSREFIFSSLFLCIWNVSFFVRLVLWFISSCRTPYIDISPK